MGLRCFISIELDEPVKKSITEAAALLKTEKVDVNWVAEEKLHLTLKFLGDTDEGLLSRIKEELLRVSSVHTPFNIKVYGAGVLPDIRRPRVVFIGLDIKIDLADSLKGLQRDIEETMASLGFKKDDRLFHPHLTIGRVKSPKGKEQLLKMIETLKGRDFGIIYVKKISLMKSELKPRGAQYTYITEFDLKNEEGQ